MCYRCVLAAVLSGTTSPPMPLPPWGENTKRTVADRPEETDTAGQDQPVESDLEDAHRTIKRREREIDRLTGVNRSLMEELERVNDLKHKYAHEALIAKQFAKILTADMAPKL